VVPVASAALAGSCGFYVVTNAACWVLWYPHTSAGLVECYQKAIPFFGYTLLGDAVYSVVLFGSLALVERLVPAMRERPIGTLSLAN
jgi:hypothetical protein